MAKVKIEDLLSTGAHFGHVTKKWNPNFKPYVLLEKNGIHIINLEFTVDCVEKAKAFVSNIVKIKVKSYLWVQKSKPKILFNKRLIGALCTILLRDG